MKDFFGFLVVDKPSGISSRDIVNIVQRRVRPAKAGHAGTLDPLATGLLVICVGRATRLVDRVQAGTKTYHATFQFGVTSETDDLEGTLACPLHAPTITEHAIRDALPEILGTIEQVPPIHSAVHVSGRRAYELARQGVDVQLKPRLVQIESIQINDFDPQTQILNCTIRCGSGTYIRSLGRDLAERLGTVAVMSQLRRLSVGPFDLTQAVSPADLSTQPIDPLILPASTIFNQHPHRIIIRPADYTEIINGRVMSFPAESPLQHHTFTESAEFPLLLEDRLVAIASWDAPRQAFQPQMVFPLPEKPCD